MNFLKENMFLAVTAAIVIVYVFAVLLVVNSRNSQSDIGAKTYVSVSRRINSLVSGGVNQATFNASGERVKRMREEAKNVADECLLRNRRDYKVLSFDISGLKVLAFPVDEKFRDRETLRLLFPEKYRLRVKDLREMLKPTVPPTPEEIASEEARISASAKPEKTNGRSGPTEDEVPRRRRHPDMDMDMDVRRPPTRRPGDAGSEIGRRALINLVVSQSEKGWIYADKEDVQAGMGDRRSAAGGTSGGGAMHVALPLADYNDDSLWLAQVGLWVQRDIVEAINLTNSQVRRTASPDQRGVAASAVKRLMGIDVRGYVFRAADKSGETTTLQYLDADKQKSSKPAPQLTGRACNKLYDVIHYDFTVILPMRHLLRMQKNLMTRNYHTILDISITKPAQSDMHYYGTDSVMKVTIVGEMLMLTDWIRVMTPVKFLEQMRETDANAMRDEDNRRLPVKTKTRGDAPERSRERLPRR